MAENKEKTKVKKPSKGKQGGDELVSNAYKLFEEFRQSYESEWQRLSRNERLYLGQHWEDMENNNPMDPKPVTPVINATCENFEADLMDNFPQAIIQPENPDDREVAEVVGALIRQNHDAMKFRTDYQKMCHDFLVGGYAVQEAGYDVNANRGIGSGFIRYVDNRNILFDPQVTNIQDGRAVFKIAPRTIEWLEKKYPDKAGKFAKDEYQLETDSELKYDDEKSVLQIEYWWKEFDADQSLWRVHMALMAGRQLLEDSRDAKPDGYFSVGEYPFVVTPFFRRKSTAVGYGIPDVFADLQMYSDKLDQVGLKNAQMASHNKMLVTEASGFDTEDLRDWSKDVHRGESLNGITWFPTPPLPAYIMQMPGVMRQAVKDESGANDFSRGNTAAGVTAASAIAALQEMSTKRSRKAAMLLHESFKEAVRYEIEFEREFNVLPREVLLTVDGEQKVATFETAIMSKETANKNTVPIEFFISIKVERENRFTTTAHNELMLQMVQMGILQPNQALELMVFEGKESVLSKSMQQGASMEEIMQQQAMEDAAAEQQDLDAVMASLPAPEAMANQSDARQTANLIDPA